MTQNHSIAIPLYYVSDTEQPIKYNDTNTDVKGEKVGS